jgi:hypothetical protein
VDGVVGEVRRDQLDVAAVQGLVVGADVIEMADRPILSDFVRRRFGRAPADPKQARLLTR